MVQNEPPVLVVLGIPASDDSDSRLYVLPRSAPGGVIGWLLIG